MATAFRGGFAVGRLPGSGPSRKPPPWQALALLSSSGRRISCGWSARAGLGLRAYGAAAESLRYWHYVPGVGWQAATSGEFFASDDPATITQIWIHGNRIDYSRRFQVGWTVYSSLARRATSEQPLRFVIWSWPSEKVGRLLEDAQMKAARTMPAAFPLARFIGADQKRRPRRHHGYSYGAGSRWAPCSCWRADRSAAARLRPTAGHARPLMDVVLIAAAADTGALLAGQLVARPCTVVNRMLLVSNSCDKVLRFYRFLYGRRSCVEALGYVGMGYANRLGAKGARSRSSTPAAMVGPEHYWANYFASPAIVGRIEPYIFDSPADAPRPPPPRRRRLALQISR